MKKLILALGFYASLQAPAQNWISTASVLNNGSGGNNTIGTNNNFPMQFYTNKFQRLKIFANSNSVFDGYAVFGNDIPTTYSPIDRITSYVTGNSGSNLMRFTGNNYHNNGLSIGNNPSSGFAYIDQSEVQPFAVFMPDANTSSGFYEWLRIQNGTMSSSGSINDGYLGLNQQKPDFHIDGITPKMNGGELFVGFTTSDVPKSKMGFCNGAASSFQFLPIFFGNIDSTLTGPAMETVAAIKGNQDISANTAAVQRFVVGKEWYFNVQGISRIDTLANRNAFAWQNGSVTNMLMNSKGRLKIANNISLSGIIDNRLVITSAANDPGAGSTTTAGGSSGLQFTHLAAATPTLANPGSGVLAVDSSGNVIYVPGAGNADNGLSTSGTTANIHFGQNVGATGNPGKLLNNREVPMNNFNIIFRDGTSAVANQNRIQLGPILTSLPSVFNPKFSSVNIANSIGRIGGLFSTIYDINSIGTVPLNAGPYYFGSISSNYKFGTVSIAADSTNGGISIGVSAFAYSNGNGSGSTAIGLSGKALSLNNTSIVTGVRGHVEGNGVDNYGGYFEASGSGGGTNAYGIWATAGSASTINYAAYFNGDAFVNGPTSGTGYLVASDQRIKKDITPIKSAINHIVRLKPVTYNMNMEFVPQLNVDKDHLQYGVIAQELEMVYPELVKEVWVAPAYDGEGKELHPAKKIKSVNYIGLIPILISGLQEQQQTISNQSRTNDSIREKLLGQQQQLSDQQKQIDELRSLMNVCCSAGSTRADGNSNTIPQTNIDLSDQNAIVLNQNVPNPFAESTYITYSILTSFKTAQIVFSTTDGRIIKVVDIKETGRGRINVLANDLSSGLYTYTLIIDGKIVDTKKMARQD